jgi:hypothetical protein
MRNPGTEEPRNGETEKPIVFDLFCGLGGWSEAFIAEGYDAIGFDIEAHDYGNGGYPGKLVLRDIRSITGSELVQTYGVPTIIVASPPCQEFSYMAMPWSKAKEKMRKILADPADQKRLCDLFNQCFRIQREVSEACGHYVPLVVENVRGAQRWVGKARWNFGSFYLWGDVPALMPIPHKIRKSSPLVHTYKIGSWDESRFLTKAERGEGNKSAGMNWSDPDTYGKNVAGVPGRNKGVSFTDAAGYAAMQAEGCKKRDEGYNYPERTFGWKSPPTTSKSSARKQASAEIAKIPHALAQWIARTYKPTTSKR